MFASFLPNDFKGCALLCQNGVPVESVACGVAEHAFGRKMSLETRFSIASGSKSFVAAGILKLVDQGTLGLDASLAAVLPKPLGQIDMNVTLRQLLCHTSGVPDYFDESVMESYADLWQNIPNYRMRATSDLLPLFIDRPMVFIPGSRFAYNNSGYVLLAYILEEVTGKPFDVFLHEAIFQPARMLDTAYDPLDGPARGCAQAYIYDAARQAYYSNIYSVDVKGSGAGGAFTTAGDIDRFWQALFSETFFSQEGITAMTAGSDIAPYYGFGVWLEKGKEGQTIVRLEGSDPGVEFVSSYDPCAKTSLTIVSNHGQDVCGPRQSIQAYLAENRPDAIILQTERLYLRRFGSQDAPALHRYLSDPQVVACEPYEPLSLAQAEKQARDFADDPAFYAVCLRQTNQLIGHLCLIPSEFSTLSLGFVFNRTYQGQGLATESARALLRYAFRELGAHRVTACCSTRHTRSIRLLERLGLQKEGLLRQNVSFQKDEQGHPIWLDSYVYACLSSEPISDRG